MRRQDPGASTARADNCRCTRAKCELPTPRCAWRRTRPGAPAGLLTGNLDYHTDTGDVSFDFTGAAIPLEAIDKIQTARLPVGGRLNLQAHGQGPLRAPEMHATLRLIDLKLGNDVVGSFDGKVDSDGQPPDRNDRFGDGVGAACRKDGRRPRGRLSGDGAKSPPNESISILSSSPPCIFPG